MTRLEIDKLFSRNYSEFVKVATDLVRLKHRSYNPIEVVNDAYLEIIKKSSKLKASEDVARFGKQYIRMEVMMSGATRNKTRYITGVDTISEDAREWTTWSKSGLESEIERFGKKEGCAVHYEVIRMILDGSETCRALAEKLGSSRNETAKLKRNAVDAFGRFLKAHQGGEALN